MITVLLTPFFILIALCYRIAPEGIIAKKSEYVMFFLLFGAGFCFLHGVGMKIIELLNMRDWISTEPFTAFMMLLFAAHLLYPFKRVNKNLRQHVNFFLFFAVLLSLAITGFMILIGLNMR